MECYSVGRWKIPKRKYDLIKKITSEIDISPIVAQILINRGVDSVEAAKDFLEVPISKIARPPYLDGFTEAVELIEKTIKSSKKILVFGDYDVDGLAASAIMIKILKKLGAQVDYYIPDRIEEGYDLNENAVQLVSEENYGLVITVDCGIKAYGHVEAIRKRGAGVIVTDHHEPGEEIPCADAVINPKLCSMDSKQYLAGAGVSFFLAQKIAEYSGLEPVEGVYCGDMLDLAALGTIADVVPLLGYNRILVKHGLKRLLHTFNEGLKALLEVEGLLNKDRISEVEASFKLIPCLNAAGRIGDAVEALKLLLSESPQEAWEQAVKLHRLNLKRQLLEKQVVNDIISYIEENPDLEKDRVIVLASEKWHSGIIGIAASRIMETFKRPAVLISIQSGIGKGSGRSRENFDLYEAYKYCEDLFIKYGGHRQAGGFLIDVDKIPLLRERINAYAEIHFSSEREEIKEPFLQADCEVFFSEINESVAEQIQMLKPFGCGNPSPKFLYRNAKMIECRAVGKTQEHLKMVFEGENQRFNGIGFGLAECQEELESRVDIVFCPEINKYNGFEEVQLNVVDIFPYVPEGKNYGALLESNNFETYDELVKLKKRIQYVGMPERVINELMMYGEQSKILGCFIFPLQSMALDFEKTARGTHGFLRIKRIDGSLFDQEINSVISEINEGELGFLITTLDCWGALERLRSAVEVVPNFLCIHMGYWNSNSPELQQLVVDIKNVLKNWEGSVFFVGKGPSLKGDWIKKSLEVDQIFSIQRDFDAEIINMSNSGKDWFINDFISHRLSTIIFVNSEREVLSLAGRLKQEDSLKPHEIKYYFGRLTESQRELALEDFNNGLAKILITSRRLEQHLVNMAERAIIHSFPLNVFDYGRFIVAPKLYLAYNNIGVQKTFNYIRRIFPNRDTLNYVYQLSGRINSNDLQNIFRKLYEYFKLKNAKKFVSVHALKTALAIINELGILGKRNIGKVNAEASWRFREIKREYQAFYSLLNQLEINRSEAALTSDHCD
ncbi:MAG: single-stranded-DNA-specific exonuclease RecJ [Clostridia bacterium]|nr:single-stranded-DNA-specific exonuclease RecJ [Clostridia bacterium]